MFTIDTEFAFLITDTDQDTADTTDLFKMAAEVTKIKCEEKNIYTNDKNNRATTSP